MTNNTDDYELEEGIKVSNRLYTEEEMMQDRNAQHTEMSVDAIPDLKVLLSNIIEMVELMEQPNMIDLCKTDNVAYERLIIHKYQDLMPYNIIKLLLRDRYENLDRMISMIQRLEQVKAGKADINEEHDKFGESLNERYLYPKFGGKEAAFKFFTEQNQKAASVKTSNKK